MAKITGFLAVLLVAAMAFAAPTAEIQNVQFTGTTLYFDVVATDMGGAAADNLYGIGIGARVTGPGITANEVANRLSIPTWTTAITADGGTFAWSSFTTTSNAALNAGLMQMVILDDGGNSTHVSNGMVLARFYYNWDGVMPPFYSVTIHVQGDNPVTSMGYLLGDAANWDITISNNDLEVPVPEPATMGLLGLGLLGLVIRRKR